MFSCLKGFISPKKLELQNAPNVGHHCCQHLFAHGPSLPHSQSSCDVSVLLVSLWVPPLSSPLLPAPRYPCPQGDCLGHLAYHCCRTSSAPDHQGLVCRASSRSVAGLSLPVTVVLLCACPSPVVMLILSIPTDFLSSATLHLSHRKQDPEVPWALSCLLLLPLSPCVPRM